MNLRIELILAIIVLSFATFSCGEKDIALPEEPNENNQTTDPAVSPINIGEIITEWGMDEEILKKKMSKYDLKFQAPNYLGYSNGSNNDIICYSFNSEDKLKAASIHKTVRADEKIPSTVNGFNHVGYIEGLNTEVFQNSTTVLTIIDWSDNKTRYIIYGYTPIKSTDIQSTAPFNIFTKEPIDVSETKVTVAAHLDCSDISKIQKLGISYGNDKDSEQTKYIYLTANNFPKDGNVSVQIDLRGSNNFYYYAFVEFDNVKYMANKVYFNLDEYLIDGHEYVDMGLSVKWATCNIGASRPEEYGDYFSWAEISPKAQYLTSNSISLNNDSFTDISGLYEYDAAKQLWGGRWRMPTKSEIEELKNNCTTELIEQGDDTYIKFISKINSNYIIIPLAGHMSDGNLCSYFNTRGYLWSSSAYDSTTEIENNKRRAYSLAVYRTKSVYVSWVRRDVGTSIRPVAD